jgi:predicted amidohydrolase YtcJ
MCFFRRLLALLPVILVFSCHSKQPADLIVYHGKVYTVDSSFTVAEAFAVRDGKILAVGSDAEIRGIFGCAPGAAVDIGQGLGSE